MSVTRAGPPQHARRLRGSGVGRAVALVATAVVLFGASAVAALGERLQQNLHTEDIGALVGPAPSPAAGPATPGDPGTGRAMNVLVIGSDQRTGANAAIGGEDDTMASDTTIVVHVAADRSRVEMVSIPRDSLVDIPSCLASNGRTTTPRSRDMINHAFDYGWRAGGDLTSAAECTARTVQANTGLSVDHEVVVDFAGFQAMVSAIGGVEICIPRPLDDPDYTGLHLPPGRQRLDGTQALQFARARHGNVGNGGDLDRIGDQQRLIAAIVNQVLSKDTLTNPAKITSFLSAATASLTVDKGLSLVSLTGLAYSLRSVGADDITLMTIPTAAAPENRNRVVWTSDARTVWATMAADRPIVRADGSLSPGPGAASSSSAGTPAPARTRQAGAEPFTPADVTAVCR